MHEYIDKYAGKRSFIGYLILNKTPSFLAKIFIVFKLIGSVRQSLPRRGL